jgi:hypothetical protein
MSKHSHYHKACPFPSIDVYRVLDLFSVTDPCLQHATKKLLVAGGRGHKDIARDVQDVIDSLERWKAMRAEECDAITEQEVKALWPWQGARAAAHVQD